MAETLTGRLVRWYRAGHRDMPWRRTRDPYAIWISEIMLQQTTVAAVIPYYERFLARFPTVAALAEAPQDDVLSRWSGLGYYSRARNLQKAAKVVVAEHGGKLPADHAALLALPGIGDYTAGAIASIAYGIAEPVLDGNVARVLARLFAIAGDPKGTKLKREMRAVAADLLDRAAPGDFNQAMMELGATVCTPKAPSCLHCPVREDCRALALGRVGDFPERTARAAPTPVRLALALVEKDGAFLMVRRTARLMKDLFEFPGGEVPLEGPVEAALAETITRELDLPLTIGRERARARHTIMNRKIQLVAHEAKAGRAALSRATRLIAEGAAAWVSPTTIGAYGVSSMALKVLRQLV